MTGGASVIISAKTPNKEKIEKLPQVNETTLREENYMATAGHCVAIDLRFNVNNRRSIGLEPCNINLNIKVSNARGIESSRQKSL